MQFAYAQSPLFFSLLWVIPFHLMAIPSESLSKQFRRAYDHLYLTGEDMEAESAVGAVVEASMSMDEDEATMEHAMECKIFVCNIMQGPLWHSL